MCNDCSPDFVEALLRRIESLELLVSEQRDKIPDLEAKLAAAQKNSRNSSKPPSSDITKPKPSRQKNKKRKIGAQRGHTAKLRTPIADDQINEHQIYEPQSAICACGGRLVAESRLDRVRHRQINALSSTGFKNEELKILAS